MGIQKFRSVEEMPATPRVEDPGQRVKRMKFVLSTLALAPDDRPRGVQTWSKPKQPAWTDSASECDIYVTR